MGKKPNSRSPLPTVLSNDKKKCSIQQPSLKIRKHNERRNVQWLGTITDINDASLVTQLGYAPFQINLEGKNAVNVRS